jgi:hypothetical protein
MGKENFRDIFKEERRVHVCLVSLSQDEIDAPLICEETQNGVTCSPAVEMDVTTDASFD